MQKHEQDIIKGLLRQAISEPNKDGDAPYYTIKKRIDLVVAEDMLEQCGYNKSECARRLGISRNTLHVMLGSSPMKRKRPY